MTTKARKIYVPLRRDTYDGHEWLDIANASVLLTVAETNAATNDRLVPTWAKANPVVRIARCWVEEETEAA